MMAQAPRVLRGIALAMVLIAAEALIWWATKDPVADIHRWVVTAQPPQGGWTLDRLIVDAAAGACLVLALLVVASTVLTVLSAYLGSAAPWVGRTARILGPRWWRHFILVTCGLGLSVPGLALAADETDTSGKERCEQECSTGLSGLPMPDLPIDKSKNQRATPSADIQDARAAIVRPGDSLWLISSSQLTATASNKVIADRVADLYDANRSTIGDDPDLIYPGQLLIPPGGTS
jgi:hypothetical protein